MVKYLARELVRPVPQGEPLDERQVKNSAGGYVYSVGDWGRLQRFLVIGAEGGTYYASQRKLVKQNLDGLRSCLREDGLRVVREAAAVSEAGRALKNGPAILALAMASVHQDAAVRRAAFEAVPQVCRIGTHLFEFVSDREALGAGWGRGMRAAVARWFLRREPGQLAFQLAKYQQREGWAMRDLLRLAHPLAPDAERNAMLRWAVKGELSDEAGAFLAAVEQAKTASKRELVGLIGEHRLPRECVPTEHLTDPDVWAALLPHMGLEALVRNLGNLSKCGLLSPLSVGERAVADRLADEAQIRRSRLHPVRILVGLLTYQSGHGQRGKGTWPVSPRAVEALDGAFYKAFKNVEPSGKRIMMACDVSGSMNAPNLMGVPGLTPMVVGAAMAMVTVKTEPNVFLVAFSHQLTPTDLGRCNRLDEVVRTLSRIPMGGTDCALPMLAAAQNKIPVDTFAMYTDNESWAGRVHVPEALKQYRKQEGIDARFVVAAMTATEYSVVDPADPGSLAIVGFDIEAPALMSDFAAGRI
jgi:60 kDa SS-A/Ro ribonucleoprotein